ncbi:MAG TPA: guanylate kinase [Rhizomicrobium sp.]|jgi:guanylate kinase|nr:guanylate kinase [Rhizomicrobium sp.]
MSNEIERRGLMLVLSSPSGAGKTTLSRRILELEPLVTMSVSVTTRPPRQGEVEGKDYFFVSSSSFQGMAKGGGFLEHAQVFGHHYGTPKEPVMMALARGRDVLFDIDWQGTQQLRQQAGDDLVSIFVLPPSHAELERRLRVRAQDAEDVVAGRMARAGAEISHWAEYDYVVINDDLETTVTKIQTILAAERMKRGRATGIPSFVSKLTR